MAPSRSALFMLLVTLGLGSSSHAGDGFVGVYADAAGTTPCTTVPQWTGTTLYVLASADGASSSGLTGSELRVEITQPSGWFFSYVPPTGSTVLGNLLDTDPSSMEDGSGMNIAFAACRIPDGGGKIPLGVLNVFNAGGSPTSLLVKRHSTPSNSTFQCPLFVLCNAPVFTQVCMSPSSQSPCSLMVEKPAPVAWSDPPVFAAGLNAELPPEGNASPLPDAPQDIVALPTLVTSPDDPDIVGGTFHYASKTLIDTFWIADWSFDGGGASCNDSGWLQVDNRILNNGQIYWSATTAYDFSGVGGITGNAAVLRSDGACWPSPGYGNSWDQSLKLNYSGGPDTLSFDYLIDTEPFDVLQVEADRLCASAGNTDETLVPSDLREVLLAVSGRDLNGHAVIPLPDYQQASCVYIRFFSDRMSSDEDGTWTSSIQAGVVVDNIVLTGGVAYGEDFESQTWNANVVAVNSAPSLPVSNWARTYSHVTDNEKCTENTTCSWLLTDPFSAALFSDMAFGPHEAIVHNWLDNIFVSPWVSTAAAGTRSGTFLSFREFPGNNFDSGRIIRSWSFRGRNGACVSNWSSEGTPGEKGTWQDLSSFQWVTRVQDASPYAPKEWSEIQVRFRVSDWQYIFDRDAVPVTFNTGPGPFIDHVRIGRYQVPGPVISPGEDTRSQAQDNFARDTALFAQGASFFSSAVDMTPFDDDTVTPGDSIWVTVRDRRGSPIVDVRFYGAIVQGPHAGKAPPPYVVRADSFFEVTPEAARNRYGVVVEDTWFVDLDDWYFRGGDVLHYLWWAIDEGEAVSTYPSGITADAVTDLQALVGPTNAERLTGGLLEVSFLPAFDWDTGYLARIAADDHGDISPTPAEVESSPPKNCILYVNKANTARRSAERTSFMYTLDKLGYAGHYDVYDLQGFGNTNNDLAGRAKVDFTAGYALIVHDANRLRTGALPDTEDRVYAKVAQDSWYAAWLTSEYERLHGRRTLWVIGENVANTTRWSPLLAPIMGLSSTQGREDHESGMLVAEKLSGFTFVDGEGGFQPRVLFPTFLLNGGCPNQRGYDRIYPGNVSPNVAVASTHMYLPGPGNAVVMRASNVAGHYYNTIFMAFPWMDVIDKPDSLIDVSRVLAQVILNNVLPANCRQGLNPSDTPDGTVVARVPLVTRLHANFPNPFNPATTIDFDLAEDGVVQLRVFDVSGRIVRTILNEPLARGRHRRVWDGRASDGGVAASGIYVYQLRTPSVVESRKMILTR